MTNREHLKKVSGWLICIAILNVLVVATYVFRVFISWQYSSYEDFSQKLSHSFVNNMVFAFVAYVVIAFSFYLLFIKIRKVPQNVVLLKIFCIAKAFISAVVDAILCFDIMTIQVFFTMCYNDNPHAFNLYYLGGAITVFAFLFEMVLIGVLDYFALCKTNKNNSQDTE